MMNIVKQYFDGRRTRVSINGRRLNKNILHGLYLNYLFGRRRNFTGSRSHWLKKIIWVIVALRRTVVANNRPSQDYNHTDDLFQSRYVTSRYKPFSWWKSCLTLFPRLKERIMGMILLIQLLEFVFVGINMFWARLTLVLSPTHTRFSPSCKPRVKMSSEKDPKLILCPRT